MKNYPKMKPSGVEWIGDVPEHWEVKKLKRLAKICNGQDHKNVWTEDGEYPILGTGGEFGRANSFLSLGPSVILGRKGTIDKPQFVEHPFWSVDTAYFTEIYDFTDPKFFFYCCTTIQFNRYKYGSAVPSMTQETLNQIPFAAPSKSEQTTIAHYLDRKTAQIDQAITEKEGLIELFREERQAIINHAVTKGIRAGVKMKPSGVEWIGDVPEEWEIVALKRRCNVIDCKHTTPIYSDEGIPIVSPGDLKPYTISLNGSRKITEEQFKDLTEGERMPSLGDIIYSRNASVGSAAFVDGKEVFCMGQDVCLIRSTHFEPLYLEALLNSHFVVEQLQSIMVGSTFKRINISQIKEFKLLVPSPQEQSEILVYMKSKTAQIDTAISGIQQEIALLQEYRQALIFEAVTGKICVV